MADPDHILVLGGSRQAEAGLKHLKSLGFALTVSDFDANAPGFAYADHRVLASVYHIDDCLPAVERFYEKHPFDGVMCLACDVPHIVARIARKFALPGISIEAADRAVHKIAMKDKFALDGVAIPNYWGISRLAQIEQIFAGGIKQLVVKPVDSRGSKGVSLLKPGGDALWAFEYAKENSPTGQVMVEEYLLGPQVSTESVVINGKTVTPALSDRSYEFLEKYYPFIVENGGDMPSSLGVNTVREICDLVDSAAKSLGVDNGIVKGDIVVHKGKPYIIELAARLSGGYFCTHQIPFSTGVNLVEACAMLALGKTLKPSDWVPEKQTFVSTRWKIVDAGKVTLVPSVDDISRMPGVLTFEHWIKVGDVIAGAQNAAASVAMVQVEGSTQHEARVRAEKALDQFNPVIEAFENTA